MVTYPYEGRDLFEESYEKKSIFNMLLKPKYISECGATGIFEVPNNQLTPELIETVMKDHVWSLFSDKHPPDLYIKKGIEFLEKNYTAAGYSLCIPPFDEKERKASLYVRQFTENWIPRLNINPDEITTLGFCMRGLSEWNKDRCQWFIDYLKKLYLLFNSEFAWCDLFDYLAKFEGKDPQKYVFGMTFYGPKIVDEIGRERLLTAPVYKVEELENGGFLLMLGEQPFFPHPKSYREAVGNHLGLTPLKLENIIVPKWLRSSKIGRISFPKERYFRLIAGAKPENILIGKTGTNLYDYFMRYIYEKKDLSSPEGASFTQWFDNLDTEIRVFYGGSRYKKEKEPFIGLPCGDEFTIDFSLKELDTEEMRSVVVRCSELFKQYEIYGQPKIHVIGYDGSKWGL